MRKFGLSAFVIVAFIAYSFYVHSQGIDALPIVEPKTIISSPTEATLNSNAPPLPTPQPETEGRNPDLPNNAPGNVGTTAIPTNPPASSGYKTGTYTGNVTDAFYGNVQIQATIQNGKITKVQFLQYPNDRQNSIMINSQAMPILNQEAIQAQSAQVDIVSGATDTSNAFIASLGSALAQAK